MLRIMAKQWHQQQFPYPFSSIVWWWKRVWLCKTSKGQQKNVVLQTDWRLILPSQLLFIVNGHVDSCWWYLWSRLKGRDGMCIAKLVFDAINYGWMLVLLLFCFLPYLHACFQICTLLLGLIIVCLIVICKRYQLTFWFYCVMLDTKNFSLQLTVL